MLPSLNKVLTYLLEWKVHHKALSTPNCMNFKTVSSLWKRNLGFMSMKKSKYKFFRSYSRCNLRHSHGPDSVSEHAHDQEIIILPKIQSEVTSVFSKGFIFSWQVISLPSSKEDASFFRIFWSGLKALHCFILLLNSDHDKCFAMLCWEDAKKTWIIRLNSVESFGRLRSTTRRNCKGIRRT